MANAEQMLEGGKLVKISKALGVIVLLFALWSAVLYSTLSALTSLSYINWVEPAVILVFFIPVITLAAIVLDRRVYFIAGVALSLVYLVFLPANLYAILAILVLFFGFWRAYWRTQFELKNNVKFAASRILKRVSGIVTIAFLLVIAFNVYAQTVQQITSDEAGFYGRLADLVTWGALPVIEKELPGFNQSMTLDQYIISGFNSNVPGFRELPPDLQEQAVAQDRSQIVSSLNLPVSGSEPLSAIAREAIAAKIEQMVKPYSAFLPLIYGLAIFSLLRIIAFFVQGLALGVGVVLFWCLRKVRFLHVSLTQIMAEYVSI